MAKKVYVPCKLFWAKLKPENRDMGKNLPEGSDQRNKIEAEQGHYLVNCVIDRETKAQMIKDGIPNKGMQGQLFKEESDGTMFYKAKRPHFNPRMKDQVTNESGIEMGPPKVVKEAEDGELVLWDWETDGLIGNGTDAIVKFDVWDGKIITLEAIKIINHVPYEATGEKF